MHALFQRFKDRARRVWRIAKRDLNIFGRRPLMVFCVLLAPILCTVFFTSLMQEGLPARLPAGLVDLDDTQTTRSIVRILKSLKTTEIVRSYASFSEARQAVQRGEIYSFFYIPRGTTEQAISSRQPSISFYTNDSYFVPASLQMKDMRTISELTGMAITRASLQAKGLSNSQIMSVLQPIVIEAHPLNNSMLNYSVLLNNLVVPGIVIILIMLTTTYTVGYEWKMGTQKYLLELADGSVPLAITGKLLPQFVLYTFVFLGMYFYFYRILEFPCLCGIGSMMLLGVLTVLVAQACGLIMFGIFAGQVRMSMSACALWGVVSIPMAGFSYPTTAMTQLLQNIQLAFPLRDYFLIYANQALNGYDIAYAWKPIVAMLVIVLLPLIFVPRYRTAFVRIDYKP